MAVVEIIPEQFPTDQFDIDAIRGSGTLSVYLVWDESVTGFIDADIALTGADGITFRGSGCCYEYVIMPTGSAGDDVTLTVNANAVNEGNVQTALTISQGERELKITALPLENLSGYEGIAVNHNRIWLGSISGNVITVHAYQHDGTLIASEERTITDTETPHHVRLDLLNDRLFVSRSFQTGSNTWGRRITALDSAGTDWVTHEFIPDSTDYGFADSNSASETPCGFTHIDYGLVGITYAGFGVFPFSGSSVMDTSNITIGGLMANWQPQTSIAGDGNVVYVLETEHDDAIQVYRFTSASTVELVSSFNRSGYSAVIHGLSVYNGKLYLLSPNTANAVYSADLPVLSAPIIKFRTPPLIMRSGDVVNLKQFFVDAEKVIWDVGYDLPMYLSITDSILTVGTVTEETPIELRLKAVNVVGATANDAFGFYAVIRPDVAPVWSDTSALTIAVGSEVDLLDEVDRSE